MHNMAPRKTGDARYSGELDVSLTANGSKGDVATAGTGAAKLTLTEDGEIEILNIESNANPADKAAAATYQNTLALQGRLGENQSADPSSVEAIIVSGNARTLIELNGAGSEQTSDFFGSIELIDASDNTGGVTFDASEYSLTQALEMVGGSGKDVFNGSSAADELMGAGGNDTLDGGGEGDTITGGAGGDKLTGGAGNNTFKYGSVSESQVVFGDKGMSGFDTIMDFNDGSTDTIALGKTLYGSLGGRVLTYENDAAISGIDGDDEVGAADDAVDNTDDSLKAFLDSFKDDGVFESRGTPDTSAVNDLGELMKHSIVTVTESYWVTLPAEEDALTLG